MGMASNKMGMAALNCAAGNQLLVGLITIGVLSIVRPERCGEFSAAIPILLLAIPILDTLSVMAQRIGEGRSPFSPIKIIFITSYWRSASAIMKR